MGEPPELDQIEIDIFYSQDGTRAVALLPGGEGVGDERPTRMKRDNGRWFVEITKEQAEALFFFIGFSVAPDSEERFQAARNAIEQSETAGELRERLMEIAGDDAPPPLSVPTVPPPPLPDDE